MAQTGDMRLDYAKTNIDAEGRALLIELLERRALPQNATQCLPARRSMKPKAAPCCTPHCAILMVVLSWSTAQDVMPEVLDTLARMESFANDVRSGTFAGQGGKITDVVNIGIGGSDLGPAMAAQALAPYHDGPRCHFVSNVDPADIAGVLRGCDPATTLVIVASKTFTTIETMTNARTAQAWMGQSVADHRRAVCGPFDGSG